MIDHSTFKCDRAAYVARLATAELLAASHNEAMLAMAWRLRCEADNHLDQFNKRRCGNSRCAQY